MRLSRTTLVSRLNPAVPRHYLFAVGGLLWTLAGVLLCIRAVIWLRVFPLSTELALDLASIALAAAGYFLLFSKMAESNINRIHGLPERVCVFAFTRWRGYFMIATMVALGVALRNSSISKVYLSIPYAVMGVMLLIGSLGFYRQFLRMASKKRG